MTRITRTKWLPAFVIAWVALFVVSGPLYAQSQYERTHALADSPIGSLAQAADGTIYGVTLSGGNGNGSIYRLTPTGPETVAAFTADMGFPSDGGGLLLAKDGAFYGTTEGGTAAYPAGTVFRFTPDGTLSVWAAFDANVNGSTPSGRLIQGSDNYIYGTALFGPGDAPGVVYRLMPAWGATGAAGVIETFAIFPAGIVGGDGPVGESPATGVTEVDGSFYGAAMFGGANTCGLMGCGTIFRAKDGAVSAVHSFDGLDGLTPTSPLLLGSDHNLYGTTLGDGFSSFGTLFKFPLDGSAMQTLVSFNGANGDMPYQQGVVESEGYLFGTTQFGGAERLGTVYRWSTTTGLEVLHEMTDAEGDGYPVATLMLASNGAPYGAGARTDGVTGVIFRLVKQAVLVVTPAAGNAGGSTDLVAQLTTGAGRPLANQMVTFSLNGVNVGSATTNEEGIATRAGVSLAGIAAGTYAGVIEASFAGIDGVLATSATGDLTVIEATPPSLQLPANMIVNATSPQGATVTYTVTASGSASISCTPASGSVFPIGVTTVNCTATSSAGEATGSFTVKVLSAAEQLVALLEKLKGMPLSAKVKAHLISFLQNALTKPRKVAFICTVLEHFKSLLKKNMSSSLADPLVADITRIQAVIGCSYSWRWDERW